MSHGSTMKDFFRLRVRFWGLLTVAAVLAVLGTIAGLFGQYAWWMDICSHFRVQYVACFAFAAVCCVVGKKKRWVWAAVVLAVVNVLPVAMFLIPPARTGPVSGASFRAILVNVNTERGNPSRVVEYITNMNPDIVVLEEVSDEWVKALGPIHGDYPVRKYVTRDDNFGIGVLSRVPCDTIQVEYFGDAEIPSIIAEFALGGRRMTLVATHPLPPGGPAYSARRNVQLEKVAARIATLEGPVLLLGDLNVTPWSYYYRRFLKTSGLIDSARGRSICPTWPTCVPLVWIQIDHCFHSKEVVIRSRKIGQNIGSDHYPVEVNFILGAEEKE